SGRDRQHGGVLGRPGIELRDGCQPQCGWWICGLIAGGGDADRVQRGITPHTASASRLTAAPDAQTGLPAAASVGCSRPCGRSRQVSLEPQPASDGTSDQEYALTPAGNAVFPVTVARRQWGEAQLFGKGEPRSQLIDTNTGEPGC